MEDIKELKAQAFEIMRKMSQMQAEFQAQNKLLEELRKKIEELEQK